MFQIKPDRPDEDTARRIAARFDALLKPIDGLGDFEKIIARIGAIRRCEMPDLDKKALVILCADNGVTEEGVSQTGSDVTEKVARMMGKSQSTAGVMLSAYHADTVVVDVGMASEVPIEGVLDRKVASGTKNIAREAAMDEKECLRAIETGIALARDLRNDYGILAAGEMGIGNTTTSTALLCALTGTDPLLITGKGAGGTDRMLEKKRMVIQKALARTMRETGGVQDMKERAFSCLRHLGGFDIAAMAGLFIGGALSHVPVVIDGLISACAALAASCMVPGTEEYMIASHSGREKGTGIALEYLGLKPVIHADLSLGEGTGAIMLFPLIDMVYAVYRNSPSFGDAGMEAYTRNNA